MPHPISPPSHIRRSHVCNCLYACRIVRSNNAVNALATQRTAIVEIPRIPRRARATDFSSNTNGVSGLRCRQVAAHDELYQSACWSNNRANSNRMNSHNALSSINCGQDSRGRIFRWTDGWPRLDSSGQIDGSRRFRRVLQHIVRGSDRPRSMMQTSADSEPCQNHQHTARAMQLHGPYN